MAIRLTETSWLPRWRFAFLTLLAVSSIATLLASIATLAYQLQFTVGYNKPIPAVSCVRRRLETCVRKERSHCVDTAPCLLGAVTITLVVLPVSDQFTRTRATSTSPSASNRARHERRARTHDPRDRHSPPLFDSGTVPQLWRVFHVYLTPSRCRLGMAVRISLTCRTRGDSRGKLTLRGDLSTLPRQLVPVSLARIRTSPRCFLVSLSAHEIERAFPPAVHPLRVGRLPVERKACRRVASRCAVTAKGRPRRGAGQ